MFYQPTYYKWNFEIQQALPSNLLLTVNYAGMHGTHLPVNDQGLNAFCPPEVCAHGFAGLPALPANPALATITQYLSAGTANYNGLTFSLQRHFAAGLSFAANYTWSHTLDDLSNGGLGEFF